jgi:hypothetical protein
METTSMVDPHPPQNERSTTDTSRRQATVDRRKRSSWSLIYGSFSPRRRGPRRSEDRHGFVADWHEPRLLHSSIAILLLSAMDAYLTLRLLSQGAKELNWFMAQLIQLSPQHFVALKMALTGLGLIVLVTRRHARLFGRIPVEGILYAMLFGYLALVGYEISALSGQF